MRILKQLPEPVPKTYHVFINHRGPDTKKNLASLIYRELNRYGLRVFLDKNELSVGETLLSEIRRAIHSASVHIAIFSKRYAESRWCLEELFWILRVAHEHTIIPVFYEVEPYHLRNIDREPYADAFEKHKRKESMEVVERWKEALKEVSYISGLVVNNESDYSEFLDEILKIGLMKVKKDPLEVAKYPIGLDEASEDLQTKLLKKSGMKVIGIGGPGGVGKSTLAKHIFNLQRSAFQRSCYLSRVRESGDLRCLQQQLLRDLVGIDRDITNTEEGKSILRNSVGGLNVLIALDDADNVQQINNLLVIDTVGSESLILITSRNKDILEGYIEDTKSHYGSMANTLLHDVKPLEKKHAQELFCHHAFLQPKPFEGYEDLVEEFWKICEGIPLCLKILGEQFAASKHDQTYWKNQLEKFHQGVPLPEMGTVINILKWSYEAMGNQEKDMLLDIGYFFAGEDSELTVRVLEGLGYYNGGHCLESLRQKCLVDFDDVVESPEVDVRRHNSDDNLFPLESHLAEVFPHGSRKIIMQNQVRELARQVGREDSLKPLRLSCCKDIENLLQSQDGSNFCQIRGIRIPNGQSPPQLTHNIDIRGVRLLVVEHPVDLSSYFRLGMSGILVWLRLCNCQYASLPSAISLQSLRVLELRGSSDGLEEFFDRLNELPSQLRELNIHACRGSSEVSSSSRQPVDLPPSMKSSNRNISSTHQAGMPSFSRFMVSLRTSLMNKIVLKNSESLETLPNDFSDLKNLIHLDLSGCSNLTNLPKDFRKLIHLQYLALRDCSHLDIPEDILGENIFSLQYVNFKGCAQLEILPSGIAHQKPLRYLNLLCTRIKELPFNLGLLDKLEQLRIGSPQVTQLPGSAASLNCLKELILFKCNTLGKIAPIEKLNLLERLEMYGLAVQPVLPPGIVLLQNIKVLAIDYCPITQFSFTNGMNTLRDFTLNHTSISSICFPQDCPRLEIVDLSYNLDLVHVEGLPSGLVRLNLKDCREMNTEKSFKA